MTADPRPRSPGSARHYYAQVPEPLILDASVTAAELRVYAWLDRRAGASGYWMTSRRGIGRALDLDDRTVRRAVDALVARGLLEVVPVGAHVSCFELPERAGAAWAPHPDHAGCGVGAAVVRRGRRSPGDRSLFRSEKPKGKQETRASRADYGQQLVMRDAEGALARLAAIGERMTPRSSSGDPEQGGVGL